MTSIAFSRRALLAFVVALLLGRLPALAQEVPTIPSPEQFFGFPMGAERQLAGWNGIVEYFQLVGRRSDRVLVQEKNVILLLIPSQNPDGQQMVVDWHNQNVGTPYEGSPLPELYHRYVGQGLCSVPVLKRSCSGFGSQESACALTFHDEEP